MVLGVVVFHALHTFYAGDLIFQLLSLVLREVGHHDPGAAVGDKLLFHNVQGLPGLRVRGQIGCKFALHLHPVAGESGKDQHDDGKQEE